MPCGIFLTGCSGWSSLMLRSVSRFIATARRPDALPSPTIGDTIIVSCARRDAIPIKSSNEQQHRPALPGAAYVSEGDILQLVCVVFVRKRRAAGCSSPVSPQHLCRRRCASLATTCSRAAFVGFTTAPNQPITLYSTTSTAIATLLMRSRRRRQKSASRRTTATSTTGRGARLKPAEPMADVSGSRRHSMMRLTVDEQTPAGGK